MASVVSGIKDKNFLAFSLFFILTQWKLIGEIQNDKVIYTHNEKDNKQDAEIESKSSKITKAIW